MRKYFVTAFVLAAMLAFATSGFALEKSAARFNDGDLGDWNAGTSSCSVFYYNICTGYIWIWTGWADGATMGTVYDTCCDPSSEDSFLNASYFYFWTGVIPGYGFTGTVGVYDVDANLCPSTPLMTQPSLPVSGWNLEFWGVGVNSQFAIVYTLQDDQGFGVTAVPITDGAGGACGVCFPTGRTSNSYTWGTDTSPACPGSPMSDGVIPCEYEFLAAAELTCEPVSVQDESWGSIKNLYR
jgi:hypothetical protein